MTTETVSRQSYAEMKKEVTDGWERGFLSQMMEMYHGNVSRVARVARMDRNHLRELLRKHNIDPNSFKGPKP
jgi:DNA-binding NtrC family response regulator